MFDDRGLLDERPWLNGTHADDRLLCCQRRHVLFSGITAANLTSSVAAGGTGIQLGYVACFGEGTLIRTPGGEVAVEALAVGDRVVTVSGEHAPVRWIGRRSYADPHQGRRAGGEPAVAGPARVSAACHADRRGYRHDVIWAEGAANETFIDDDGGQHLFAATFGEAPDSRPYAPRVAEGIALQRIRDRLAARAGVFA